MAILTALNGVPGCTFDRAIANGAQLIDRAKANRVIIEGRKAGAKNIFNTGYLAAHPGGTVKVGDLLDTDLKTEYDNLYVCDCSVIPEAWGLPPTLAIISLGKRLAKHLSGESSTQESLEETVEDR